ncbi:MAG: SDR family NAD(P)-dependent oxidoreductase [Kordiimonadaceae bacterium]|nr:SDR family NAD(P)-dependent oxidoreductase [Kordiimonadaceae bacterium]
MGKKAIIIGATSGIGRALAEQMSADGYTLGITGRRVALLDEIKGTLPSETFIQQMDVTDTEAAAAGFASLVKEMGPVDLVIISAGIGHPNPGLDAALELETIETNVSGFVVIAGVAFNHFKEHGKGHIVGISSIAALRGGSIAPAYGASKAFVSNYMEALRIRAVKKKLNITVTDVLPGFVDTSMAKGNGMFWVAPVEKAAAQIITAIRAKKSRVYITKRWRLIAWVLRILPEWLYAKS